MALLEKYEEKWYRNAIAAFKVYWVEMVKRAESFDAFVKGIAFVTGLDEATVRASLPATHWKEFQAIAERYLPKALAKIEAAFRARKWSTKYKAVWTRRA